MSICLFPRDSTFYLRQFSWKLSWKKYTPEAMIETTHTGVSTSLNYNSSGNLEVDSLHICIVVLFGVMNNAFSNVGRDLKSPLTKKKSRSGMSSLNTIYTLCQSQTAHMNMFLKHMISMELSSMILFMLCGNRVMEYTHVNPR